MKILRIIKLLCLSPCVVGVMICIAPEFSHAQDLEKLKDQKIVGVTGGFSANTTFYNANGIDNRRDPFYWMLNANLNFNILGIIQAPFSATLSQQDKNFAQPQPFNRFGLSPTYKSFTGHFGHRTMQFSEYTLAGNMFLGVGGEWNEPGRAIRISAMYGRLAKAVQRSAQQGLVFANPAFKRRGYGVKVGVGRKKHLVDLILFRAADDSSSIAITDEVKITPEENLVAAVHGQHALTERIQAEFEYAYSLFTRDTRAVSAPDANYSFANNLGGLFKPNIASEFNKAFTGSVVYSGDGYQANLKYRKIDPGYRSLGSAFLNNGLKDLAGGLSWSMLQQKLSISFNAGLQENDSDQKIVRGIYSVATNYSPLERANISLNYSNFSTATRQSQLQRDLLSDTLEYFQVTRNASASFNVGVGSTERPTSLNLSVSAQDATDNNATSSTFVSLSMGAQKQIHEQLQAGLNATANENITSEQRHRSIGPVLNISNAFFKGKVRTAFAAAMLNTYIDSNLQSKVYNMSLTNSIRFLKKHSVAFNVYFLLNNAEIEGQKDFNELRAMVNYNFSF